MRILTADQIKKAESTAFERYFTEAQLMKKAGENALKKSLNITASLSAAKRSPLYAEMAKTPGMALL